MPKLSDSGGRVSARRRDFPLGWGKSVGCDAVGGSDDSELNGRRIRSLKKKTKNRSELHPNVWFLNVRQLNCHACVLRRGGRPAQVFGFGPMSAGKISRGFGTNGDSCDQRSGRTA